MNLSVSLLITGISVLIANGASAEDYNLGKGVADKDAIIRMLTPEESESGAATEPPVKTRGISMEPIHKAIRTPKPRAEKAVSLQVYFDYKSAVLSDEARRQLAPLGEALASDRLKRLDFTIEGHTDSKGGVSYNQELSERRAEAVKTFLVTQYGIDSTRVNAVGRGKSTPLDTANPTSAVNRRVRVIARQ